MVSMQSLKFEKQFILLVPLISTVNLVIIPAFMEFELLYSNRFVIRAREERNNKVLSLPSGQWCRNCSSDGFNLKETKQVYINCSRPMLCEVYACDKCGREVEYWNYS